MGQVLLDQNVPVGVRRILAAHDVRTVYQMGWAGLLNGDLLDQAVKTGIEIFVTCDQNIPFQQNLTARPIAVVVLATNRWSVIQAEPSAVEDAVTNANPGVCSVVTF
jgi:hypothetical protein